VKTDDAFLLHAANRAFLDGKKRLPVGMARPGTWFVGGLALLLTLSGLVLVGRGLWEYRKEERLRIHGVKTRATVVKIDATNDPDASSDSDTESVTYRYSAGPPDGRRDYEVTSGVGGEHSGGLHVGWAVDIRYDPADPSVSLLESRFEECQRGDVAILIEVCAAATLVGLIWLLIWYVRGLRPLWRLIRQGRKVRGEVVDCGGRQRGDDYQVTLTYRFTHPDGTVIEGRAEAVRDDLADAVLPGAGTPVVVYYVDANTYAVL
jgi:hypothetical protein